MNDKRLSRVIIRVTLIEKTRWKETARRDGLDLSSFIRRMMSIRIGSKPKHNGPPSGRSS